MLGTGISGCAAAKLLRKNGKEVALSDTKSPDKDVEAKLIALGCRVLVATNQHLHLDGITHLVPSPGVSLDSPVFRKAQKIGVEIISELDLAFDGYQGKVLGITGTNGKTTTTEMVAFCLQELGKDGEFQREGGRR